MHLRLALATALAVVVIVARARFGAPWPWLTMNLALAWIPVGLGLLARRRALLPLVLPAWVLFLPNAPYLVTDLIHLAPRKHVPLWYDATLLGGVAALGLALGVASLTDVTESLERHVGRRVSLAVWVVVPWLAGPAIHIGRYSRWNSWDVVSNPRGLLGDVLMLVTDPRGHDLAYILLHGALFATAAFIAGGARPARPAPTPVAA